MASSINRQQQAATRRDTSRDHPCAKCDKTFQRPSHLENHVKVEHQGEKPYTCSQCDAKYNWATDLSRHKKREHPEEGEPTTYPCPHCGKVYSRKSTVNDHVHKKHSDEIGALASSSHPTLRPHHRHVETEDSALTRADPASPANEVQPIERIWDTNNVSFSPPGSFEETISPVQPHQPNAFAGNGQLDPMDDFVVVSKQAWMNLRHQARMNGHQLELDAAYGTAGTGLQNASSAQSMADLHSVQSQLSPSSSILTATPLSPHSSLAPNSFYQQYDRIASTASAVHRTPSYEAQTNYYERTSPAPTSSPYDATFPMQRARLICGWQSDVSSETHQSESDWDVNPVQPPNIEGSLVSREDSFSQDFAWSEQHSTVSGDTPRLDPLQSVRTSIGRQIPGVDRRGLLSNPNFSGHFDTMASTSENTLGDDLLRAAHAPSNTSDRSTQRSTKAVQCFDAVFQDGSGQRPHAGGGHRSCKF